MKLCECTYGQWIIEQGNGNIGVIVGITNYFSEQSVVEKKVIREFMVDVKWLSGATYAVRPDNIKVFKS
jgi:hypothetical protein